MPLDWVVFYGLLAEIIRKSLSDPTKVWAILSLSERSLTNHSQLLARQTMAQVMNEGKPVWSKDGQWVRMPVPEAFKQFCCGLCVPCIAGQLPFLRGIPTGSIALSQAEKDALCVRMAGHWKIQQLGVDMSAPKKNIGNEMWFCCTYSAIIIPKRHH